MIASDVVYLKVDDTNRAKFIETGSVPLKPFKSNATVFSFYNIPAAILEDSEAFIRWA
ncbi:TfoX/Sxy family protein [Aureibaculum luteum]|uniref:TfoX/Sxy family protein n=1 Tax=Aureibaculum luteum TaxID=1548456 RepID=UPI000E5380F6|nr:TfoX/Sxy family protein [Aureibaculum luteum]